MKRHSRITFVLAVLTIVGLLSSACQSAPAPVPSAPAKAEAPKAVETKAAEAKPAEAKPAEAKPAEPAKPAAAAKPEAKEPYKIGVVIGLTGALAIVGPEFRDGVAMEAERVNAAGGIDGHPIQLIVEDDGGDPTRAATSITKLIRQDNVLALIGPWADVFEPAARPVTEREQIPQIMPSPTNAEMRAKSFKWSFNQNPNEIVGAAAMLDVLKFKGYKKVVAIAEARPVYLAMLEKIKADAPAAGIQIVEVGDTVAMKDIDVTPQALKVKDLIAREKPQALLAVTTVSSAPFVKAMKQLGIDVPIVISQAAGFPFFLPLMGDAANGLILPGMKFLDPQALPDSEPQKAVIVDYIKRFEARYGKKPIGGAYPAYDVANILIGALKAGGSDRGKIRDAIENTKNFAGVCGIYSYGPNDHEGFVKQNMAIYEIKDQKFVLQSLIK